MKYCRSKRLVVPAPAFPRILGKPSRIKRWQFRRNIFLLTEFLYDEHPES